MRVFIFLSVTKHCSIKYLMTGIQFSGLLLVEVPEWSVSDVRTSVSDVRTSVPDVSHNLHILKWSEFVKCFMIIENWKYDSWEIHWQILSDSSWDVSLSSDSVYSGFLFSHFLECHSGLGSTIGQLFFVNTWRAADFS